MHTIYSHHRPGVCAHHLTMNHPNGVCIIKHSNTRNVCSLCSKETCNVHEKHVAIHPPKKVHNIREFNNQN